MSEPPRQPGEEAPEGEKPKPGARYPLIVGIAFVALIAYATYNSIQTDEGGLLGAEDAERGRALPEFAVPDIDSDLEGDANVFQDDCETSQNPCPEPRDACVSDRRGARDPRLRPLRQATRDLVLVHRRRRLPRRAGRLQPRVGALRAARSTSSP